MRASLELEKINEPPENPTQPKFSFSKVFQTQKIPELSREKNNDNLYQYQQFTDSFAKKQFIIVKKIVM